MNDSFLLQLLQFLQMKGMMNPEEEDEEGLLRKFGKPVPRAPSFPMPRGMVPPRQPWSSPIGNQQQAQEFFRNNGTGW